MTLPQERGAESTTAFQYLIGNVVTTKTNTEVIVPEGFNTS